ncbi:hypothetical protein IMG5_023480 [Ichthyophthirius multifiliis]|uniref:Vesicle transport protein n=1 Tax=Ichthyophthirius multifiliis TaxID=5932 RepID=G0QKX3_ICHMU|nr:hypothetical protein IMG5_023480 [Ichthyophthirius multifiliis]EGR34124.1 hypothetical protein IMG5_023480 [Ichthyophthirius multifiliis]|eukprot:XP_004039428.1 hypothetical protein IMG5_023480 [Ichthyophthirius multifiliis]
MSGLLAKATDNKNELCPSLTYKQRLIGFITCSVLGQICSILATILFVAVKRGSPAKFAIIFTIGNIISLAGICVCQTIIFQNNKFFQQKF